MNHWATDLIGLPWVYGGRGPNEFDCWGFVRYVQEKHYGIIVPDLISPTTWIDAKREIEVHRERQNWNVVTTPADGDIVLMARSRNPVHIGVAVAAGRIGVLHCVQGMGVLFQPEAALQAVGWGKITYYRHV